MKNLLAICLLLLPLQATAQYITWLHPNLPADKVIDVQFINQDEVLFANQGGAIFKSYDQGDTWQRKAYFRGCQLDKMYFVDLQRGYIKSNCGVIYTTDAGESWHRHQITLDDAEAFYPLSRSKAVKSTIDGNIYYLDNFYDNWKLSYQIKTFRDSTCIDCGRYVYPYGHVQQFVATPSGKVLALGINRWAARLGEIDDSLSFIMKSEDQGASWDSLWTGLRTPADQIAFNNDTLGWMSQDTTLYKTNDGGQTWTKQHINGEYFSIMDLNTLADDELFALAFHFKHKLIKSHNSGESWKVKHTGTDLVDGLEFLDRDTGFIFGRELKKTEDGGRTFAPVDTSVKTTVHDLDFVSPNKGYALNSDGLYITRDGGSSWEKLFNPHKFSTNLPGALEMTGTSEGWLAAGKQMIRIRDSGNSADTVDLRPGNYSYGGVEFLDAKLGIVYNVSDIIDGEVAGKRLLITADSGKTWESVPVLTDTSEHFSRVQFTDPSHLWGINKKGLWLSRDTAKSWQNVLSDKYVYTESNCFNFYNSSVGMVKTAPGDFYVTLDGGSSWTSTHKAVLNHPSDCKVIGPNIFDEYRFFETGPSGHFYVGRFDTTGVIRSYGRKDTYTGEALRVIDVFMDDNTPHVWAAGNGFSVIYRKWENVWEGIDRVSTRPLSFALEKNYPNPFNPTTTIKFSLAKASNAHLAVYNVLGRKVRELFKAHKRRGTYTVQFDATDLSSGIYIYRLKAGDYVRSRKMILIK